MSTTTTTATPTNLTLSTISTRADLAKLASEIEELSFDLQEGIRDNDNTIFGTASLLSKKTITLAFVLGEISASESASPKKLQRKTKVVSNPNGTNVNRTYLRDNRGRFSSK